MLCEHDFSSSVTQFKKEIMVSRLDSKPGRYELYVCTHLRIPQIYLLKISTVRSIYANQALAWFCVHWEAQWHKQMCFMRIVSDTTLQDGHMYSGMWPIAFITLRLGHRSYTRKIAWRRTIKPCRFCQNSLTHNNWFEKASKAIKLIVPVICFVLSQHTVMHRHTFNCIIWLRR